MWTTEEKPVYRDWSCEIREIIATYKEDNKITDALDGDQVAKLINVLHAEADLNEGNITRDEYLEMLNL